MGDGCFKNRFGVFLQINQCVCELQFTVMDKMGGVFTVDGSQDGRGDSSHLGQLNFAFGKQLFFP